MIRNETTAKDNQGQNYIVEYVEIERQGDTIIAREWSAESNQVTTRDATQVEVDQLVTHEQMSDDRLTIPKSAVEQLATDMADPTINSIAEMKTAINNFLEKIV